MSITMTIEVSPEQAVLIAGILKEPTAVQTTAQPVASVPAAPSPAAVPVMPVQSAVPVQNAVPLPVAAPAPVPASAPVPVQAPTAPPVAAPPTAVRKYTANELSIASRPIVEAGRQKELLDLLHSFTFTDANGITRNVQNMQEMPEELYTAFANGIRQLGGRI